MPPDRRSGLPWHRAAGSAELRLICACIATAAGGQEGACQAVLAAGRPDWILFLTLALEHNVGGLVAAALAALPAEQVPAFVVAALSAHGRHTARRNREALEEQHRLLCALEAAGIAGVPLKGAWLCQRAYRDLAARPSRDIDFLVPSATVLRVLPVLEACGYAVATGLSTRQLQAVVADNCEFTFLRHDGRFAIEPHWAFAPRHLALDIDMPAIWQRVQPVAAGGMIFSTLAAEDEVILLCVHGGKEEWTRLKWLADLAAFVTTASGLDWSVVAERARRQGVRRIVELGVLLLHEACAIRSPLLVAAIQDPQVRRLAQRILRRMEAAAGTRRGSGVAGDLSWVSSLRLQMREHRRDQLRYVVRSIITPNRLHFRMVRLPARLHVLYVVVKLAVDYVLWPFWLVAKRLAPGFAARIYTPLIGHQPAWRKPL